MKRAKLQVARAQSADFEKTFLAADYDACLAILDSGPQSDEQAVQRAAVLLRQRKYTDVIEALSSAQPRGKVLAAKHDMLLGAALGYTKDYANGRAHLLRAKERAARDASLSSEVSFFLALNAWMALDNRAAQSELQDALTASDLNLQARALILQSWIAARRHDVESQVRSLTAALDCLDRISRPDEYFRGTALMTLALLCREMPLHETAARVEDVFHAMNWTASLDRERFQTTRFLGWIKSLGGNELAAFRYFKAALESAPSDAWRVLCFLDRSMLARSRGEDAFALDQLHDADALAATVSWSETNDEQRSALILLAELYAEHEPPRAQRYLAMFRSLSTSVLPAFAYSTDPRVRAFANYSMGTALLRLGEQDGAESGLRDAWEVFEEFHYGWRAALAALALYRCTGDASWIERAKRRIKPWPQSWIARDIRQASVPSEPKASVPAAQRQVLELLLQGASNAEIAARLERSPHTIRNQVAALFRRFNTKSRTELAAKLLLPPHLE